MLAAIPRNYSRVSDKKLAANVVEQALAEYLAQPATGAAAWTAVGRHAAGGRRQRRRAGGRAARARRSIPRAEGPALLALELMDPKLPQAEPIVRRYLEGKPLPELRMGYARALLDAQRYAEATQQLQVVTTEKPDYPEGLAGAGHAAAAGQPGRRRRGVAQALHRAGARPAHRRGTQPRLGPGLPVAVADRRKTQGLRAAPAPGWTRSRTRRTWWPRRTAGRRSWRARASWTRRASCCARCPSARPRTRASS